jgi:dTDP-4-dehydrorhamnose reductase
LSEKDLVNPFISIISSTFADMKQILITGASGQLGRAFARLASFYPQFSFHLADREVLDLSHLNTIASYFDQHHFDACINCGAYTAVDKAESDIELATLINTKAPEYVAKACARKNIPLIHYSTDYVYHNQQNTPFIETDATSPKGVYAQTKLAGSLAALAAHQQTMVIRTSWVYSPFGHNFVKTMLRLGRERDTLNIVFDQIGTPTYACDLAKATLDILNQTLVKDEVEPLHGFFHYSNEGICSWYDFALAIFELTGIACQVHPIRSSEYPTPARRPAFSVLDKQKIKTTFQVSIPHWRASLAKCLDRIKMEEKEKTQG